MTGAPRRDLRHRLAITLFGCAVLLLVAGCASGSATPGASGGAPGGTMPVDTPEAAVARVQAVDTRFVGIGPKDPDLIGQSAFHEVVPSADGFRVTFDIGWGDCPAGCIEHHQWVFQVDRDGTVRLVDEVGDALPPNFPPDPGGGGGGGGILPGMVGIRGRALAGPTCPVVTANDPSCDPRPLPGVVVVVLDAGGREIARTITDAEGRYAVTLPAGNYTLEPQPVEGMMGNPEPLPVTVGDSVVELDIPFDTGIR